jgi:hypothetical protein
MISENGSPFNDSLFNKCGFSFTSQEEDDLMADVNYWLEGVVQSFVGILGIIGNVTAIVVYISGRKKFKTIFYRLLVEIIFNIICIKVILFNCNLCCIIQKKLLNVITDNVNIQLM